MAVAFFVASHERDRPDRGVLYQAKVSNHYRLTQRRMRPRPPRTAWLIVSSLGPQSFSHDLREERLLLGA